MKKVKKQRRGKLIVVEGADGTGKATQAELLVEYLRKNKIRVRYYDFPQYHKTFFGDMVARFLRGEYGKFKDISPYLVTLPYALDRAVVAEEINAWLERGGWIVCNRYVSSHLAHQTAKISTSKERSAFLQWAMHLEYVELGVVREDTVILLQVPHRVASKLILKKSSRAYLKNKKRDEAEKDTTHQKTAGEMYTALARKFTHWKSVQCMDRGGKLLPIATIHEKVVQSVADLI